MNTVQIRQIVLADCPVSVVSDIRSLFEQVQDKYVKNLEEFFDIVDKNFLIGAFDGNKLIGMMLMSDTNEFMRKTFLNYLSINNQYDVLDIAERLVGMALAIAEIRGAFWAQVIRHRCPFDLESFYRSLGFEYTYGPNRYALKLNPEPLEPGDEQMRGIVGQESQSL